MEGVKDGALMFHLCSVGVDGVFEPEMLETGTGKELLLAASSEVILFSIVGPDEMEGVIVPVLKPPVREKSTPPALT
jgi:hypothetical protein